MENVKTRRVLKFGFIALIVVAVTFLSVQRLFDQ